MTRHCRCSDRARWSSLNGSGPLRPEPRMRLGLAALRGSNPGSSAAHAQALSQDSGDRACRQEIGHGLEVICPSARKTGSFRDPWRARTPAAGGIALGSRRCGPAASRARRSLLLRLGRPHRHRRTATAWDEPADLMTGLALESPLATIVISRQRRVPGSKVAADGTGTGFC
jgi:hypothetical protein